VAGESLTAEPDLRDDPAESRHEISLGGRSAGLAVYHVRPGALAFLQAEIVPGFRRARTRQRARSRHARRRTRARPAGDSSSVRSSPLRRPSWFRRASCPAASRSGRDVSGSAGLLSEAEWPERRAVSASRGRERRAGTSSRSTPCRDCSLRSRTVVRLEVAERSDALDRRACRARSADHRLLASCAVLRHPRAYPRPTAADLSQDVSTT